MRKAKSVAVELLPPPARILTDEATLEKLVGQKIAEMLRNRDELIFEPFFRSRQVAYEGEKAMSVKCGTDLAPVSR